MVANTLIIYRNDHISFELPDLQDQKSLTRCWCSISEWCRERETRSFAYKASQYRIYEWSQPIAMQITNDARPKIVDAMLTLCWRYVDATLTLRWHYVDATLTLILPWVYPQHAII